MKAHIQTDKGAVSNKWGVHIYIGDNSIQMSENYHFETEEEAEQAAKELIAKINKEGIEL